METAIRRLKREYIHLKKDPVPYITAEPLPSNILEWHFIMQGPENSPFEGGYYHGKLIFPEKYPFIPPKFYMVTPSGRLAINVSLCLTMSAHHPEEWDPSWTVSTLLEGFLSFILEENSSPSMGSQRTSAYEKQKLAVVSLDFNLKNNIVKELFPEIFDKMSAEVQRRKLEAENAAKENSGESSNPFSFLNIESFKVLACTIVFSSFLALLIINDVINNLM
ncbi:ubiquitin-conjugating enzyme E2 J2-like [Artemia franciscana]|uniref:ubiquitin-conjugating enzyme E2 J2-like n=1 Tax=Artemia franciscana TaxID=6661 RepID=UPI0032DA9127